MGPKKFSLFTKGDGLAYCTVRVCGVVILFYLLRLLSLLSLLNCLSPLL